MITLADDLFLQEQYSMIEWENVEIYPYFTAIVEVLKNRRFSRIANLELKLFLDLSVVSADSTVVLCNALSKKIYQS